VLTDAELLDMAGEPMTGEFWPLSVSTPVSSTPMPARRSATWSTKLAASRADLSPATGADGVAGGGVDRGELPDRADAPGLADLEGVQGDQVTGAGGKVAEPERPLLGRGGQDAGGGRGQLRQGGHPLGPSPEPVAPQELVGYGNVFMQLVGTRGGDRRAGRVGGPGLAGGR
jgi:hypothetical protein